MARDPYETFARDYDAWQAGYVRPFSLAVLPVYEREILRRGVPEESLADLACGTGLFLEEWSRRHPTWRLLGVDRSAAMLRAARKRLAPARPRLLRQPIESFALPRRVGAAVCVFDSVNHLLRLSDLRGFFRRVARALLPGGLLLFDCNDERAFRRLFQGEWTVENDGLFVSVRASHDRRGRIGSSRFTIFRESKGRWRKSDFTIRERNWARGEIESAIDASGLRLLRVRRIAPYQGTDIDALRTLWICRAPRLPTS